MRTPLVAAIVMAMATTELLPSLEIAQNARLRPAAELADAMGLAPEEIDLYSRFKAKIALDALERLRDRPDGRLVCVTSITPTQAGEGKTTTAIGLVEGLGAI